MRAISVFILDAGTSTVLCRAMSPLRRRVSRSAIGSVMLIVLDSSPARLGHPGEGSLQGQVPEADPADLELAQVAARPSAAPAPVVLPDHEFPRTGCLRHPRLGRHRLLAYCCLRKGMPRPVRRALASSSVRAVVTMHTFIPLTFCTLA